MIVWQGWLWGGLAAAAAGTGILVLLQFLRVRRPGRRVPSIMLWLDAEAPPLRRVLRERFSRLLSLLCPLIAVLALTFALAGPVGPSGRNAPKPVIVADPGALDAADRIWHDTDPQKSALVLASGGGVILRDFGSHPLPLVRPKEFFPPDPDALPALAEMLAGKDGIVCRVGGTLPAWLPRNSLLRPVKTAESPVRSAAPVRIALVRAPKRFAAAVDALPGVRVVERTADAEFVFVPDLPPEASDSMIEREADRLWCAFTQSGLRMPEARQRPAVPEKRPILPRADAVRLSDGLLLLAAAAFLLDFLLWLHRKIV